MAYGYFFEAFIAFYSGSTYERFMMQNRWFGPYAVFYWSLILFNILMPQVLWVPKIRANTRWLFLISLVILVGMWLERFVIIVTSLQPRLPAVVVGALRRRRAGTMRCLPAPSASSPRPCLSSFASCRRFRSSKCGTLLPESEVKAK